MLETILGSAWVRRNVSWEKHVDIPVEVALVLSPSLGPGIQPVVEQEIADLVV